MFHRKSFKQPSFSAKSWRFDESAVVQPPATVIPYGSGRMVYPEPKKRRRRDADDDVLMFLLR